MGLILHGSCSNVDKEVRIGSSAENLGYSSKTEVPMAKHAGEPDVVVPKIPAKWAMPCKGKKRDHFKQRSLQMLTTRCHKV